jgi:hypothetical protein
MKRGKKSGRQKATLPEGYLGDRYDATPPALESAEPASGC